MRSSSLITALAVVAVLRADDFPALYRKQLSSLDAKQPESVCAARTALRKWMPQADIVGRAAMFREFRRFYLESPQTTNAQFEEVTRSLAAPEIRRAAAPWLKCGLAIGEGEGMTFPEPDPKALLEFAPQLPADLAAYIGFRAREDAQSIGGDAALALSWEQLRSRLGRWEEFARRYPRLDETSSEVQPAIRILASSYFFGEDNTWTFDSATGRIKPALISSWRNMAAQDRQSRYHDLAAALSRNGGKLAATDGALFAPYGLEEEFERWWKYREAQLKSNAATGR